MATNPGILMSGGGLSRSDAEADLKEGAFRRPQVVSEHFPVGIPLWSTQVDRANLSKYAARQILAAPSNLVEWFQLSFVPLAGAAIKYTIWYAWTIWGWYALIPGLVLAGSIISLAALGITDSTVRIPTIFKFLLVCAGGIL